jgi:hypothetical protein
MDKQAIFDFLKNHLEVRLASKDYYRPDATCYKFELSLTNPATDKPERIAESNDFTIYKD